jgi:hypothetical protein
MPGRLPGSVAFLAVFFTFPGGTPGRAPSQAGQSPGRHRTFGLKLLGIRPFGPNFRATGGSEQPGSNT